MYVLDTSAFINGNASALRGYTTPHVLSELRSVESNAYTWVIGERVLVEEPLPYFIRLARKKVFEVGETRLSDADVSVLALSLQKKAPLVTDDYALQNVALYAGITVYDTGFGRIRRVVKYVWRCAACGTVHGPGTKRCSVCGAKVSPTPVILPYLRPQSP